MDQCCWADQFWRGSSIVVQDLIGSKRSRFWGPMILCSLLAGEWSSALQSLQSLTVDWKLSSKVWTFNITRHCTEVMCTCIHLAFCGILAIEPRKLEYFGGGFKRFQRSELKQLVVRRPTNTHSIKAGTEGQGEGSLLMVFALSFYTNVL